MSTAADAYLTREDRYDTVLARLADSPALRSIYQEVYGADYPAEADPPAVRGGLETSPAGITRTVAPSQEYRAVKVCQTLVPVGFLAPWASAHRRPAVGAYRPGSPGGAQPSVSPAAIA